VDLAVVIGLVLAVGAILGSNAMEGGKLVALFNPSAALLVFGGTVGATAISHSLKEILRLPALVLQSFRQPVLDPEATGERIVAYAQKARREGLLSLEAELSGERDPFLLKGLQMVVDGADPEMVRSVLETEIAVAGRRARASASVFETAGGYAPTMGIIGTVMGLIHVLSNLSDAAKLGPAIAVAFLATFYGVSSANVFWLPLAAKLKHRAAEEAALKELVLEGVLSIQRGDNPSLVREKLSVFLTRDGKPKAGQERTQQKAAPSEVA
jgi:chemotaxis protein MotA